MAGFADDLGTALSGTLQRATAPPPPPPQRGFADYLSAFFGAPPDIEGAYAAGIENRSKYNVQSAQTLNALAEAEKRRTESVRQSQINDLITKAQSDPAYAPSVSDLLTISTGAGDFTQGRLRDQEFGNRSTLADPSAAPGAQFAAGQAVKGEVLPRLYDVGGETVNMAADPSATFQTPAQQAKVAADVALEHQRMQPAAAPSRGAFTIGNTRYAADGTPIVTAPDSARPASATERNKVSTNRAALAQIDAAMAEVKAHPGAFGAQNFVGDTIMQRLDPEGVGPRSALGNLSSLIIHNRYGSAQSKQELERAGFVARERDTADAILAKLQKYRDYVESETAALEGGAAPTAPAAPPAAPGGADPRVKQYADQYLGGDVAKAEAILRKRGAIQ